MPGSRGIARVLIHCSAALVAASAGCGGDPGPSDDAGADSDAMDAATMDASSVDDAGTSDASRADLDATTDGGAEDGGAGVCDESHADCNGPGDGSDGDGCETELHADIDNCGECGNECPARPHAIPSCDTAGCTLECEAGWLDCNGPGNGADADGCEADGASIDNCGECGVVCEAADNASAACLEGGCGLACDDGWGDCDGDASNGCEAAVDTADRCGACDVSCDDAPRGTAVCVDGGCALSCEAGTGDCDEDLANGCEDDLDTVDHCGGCGIACDTGEVCCGGSCVDISSDGLHCGGCDSPCPSRTCIDSECALGVFVTSTAYDGDLGGIDAADAACQTVAGTAGLGGTWAAWLSIGDGVSSPASRFSIVDTTRPIARLDGTLVADGWADLTDGELAAPIEVDETGSPVDPSEVWTNTPTDGTSPDCTIVCGDCNGWTSTLGQAVYGHTDSTNSSWTVDTFGGYCSAEKRLYCFEQ